MTDPAPDPATAGDGRFPNQADGGGKRMPTPQGHVETGGGESGGGAYKHPDVQDGDNRERLRKVETGREPKE